jgi:heptose I phosphotransferase
MDLVEWDDGRLQVNRQFSHVLEANGLTTCDALLKWPQGQIVRQIKSRSTSRIVLAGNSGEQAFYIKRHGPPRLRERIRPLLNLSWPILGARNEWEAILRFRVAGLPTVTPVAFGELQQHSLVMTQDLGTDFTLIDWVNETADRRQSGESSEPAELPSLKRRLIHRVAAIARQMHECGIHHQDFYLNHMLWLPNDADLDIRLIDLGRVVQTSKRSRRLIIKDLAQLDFSARRLPCSDRLRFLRLYLGRPFRASDRWLIACITRKSRHIAAHTAKHKL